MSITANRADSVAVVGVGTTDYGRLSEHDATSLGIWALREAAADAGLTLKDIDGLVVQRLTDYQKFIQITKARPTRFCSGTKPQKRLSALLSRLSPMAK